MKKFSRKSSFCLCGCGQRVSHSKNRFINTHNFRLPHTEEFKERLRERHKIWNPMDDPESRRKVSEATKGVPKHTKESKAKLRAFRLGKHLSDETKKKIGSHPFRWTEDYKGKQRIKSLGRKHTEEAKRKIGEGNFGPGNGQWNGGSSFIPYSPAFNGRLKMRIRQRDKFSCRRCGIKQRRSGRLFPVHHVNYNKDDCKDLNLLTLCMPCHNTTTGGNRQRWQKELEVIANQLVC